MGEELLLGANRGLDPVGLVQLRAEGAPVVHFLPRDGSTGQVANFTKLKQ